MGDHELEDHFCCVAYCVSALKKMDASQVMPYADKDFVMFLQCIGSSMHEALC